MYGNGGDVEVEDLPDCYPPEMVQLCRRMIKCDPSQRPSIDEVVTSLEAIVASATTSSSTDGVVQALRTRVVELEGERDAAVRDKDAAVARAQQLQAERDTAVAAKTQLQGRLDAAVAAKTHLQRERDAAIRNKEAAETRTRAAETRTQAAETRTRRLEHEKAALTSEKAALATKVRTLLRRLESAADTSGRKQEETHHAAVGVPLFCCRNMLSDVVVYVCFDRRQLAALLLLSPMCPSGHRLQRQHRGASAKGMLLSPYEVVTS